MGFLGWLFGEKQKAGTKQNVEDLQRIAFQVAVYDEGEQVEPNRWYQKATWKNKQFIAYKGDWGPDWRYASDFPGESNVRVAGISRGERAYYFLKLAQSDHFKMYIEDDPLNPVDKNARKVMVSATIDGKLLTKHIGYLPDEIANQYAGIELHISPKLAFLPSNTDSNVGIEVVLLRRTARYLKKKAKEKAVKE